MIVASQPSSSSTGDSPEPDASVAPSTKLFWPYRAMPMPTQIPTITSVTSGPAIATLNSSPGLFVSRESFATPPKNHRSIPVISMPERRATSAWPSSWSTSETKNSSTLTTAVP